MSSKEQVTHKVPVSVLTGYLGAGKTTLLNHILTADHGQKIAVIVNEFGEVGIDNQLVVGADEEIFEMNNGCICCTVRGDLIRVLRALKQSKLGNTDRQVEFDRVVIETTGLADPGPVVQTFFVDREIADFFELDAVVTVVDALHLEQHLAHGHEAGEQIAFADVILLNKTDLVDDEELQQLEKRLQRMNHTAQIHRTEQSNIQMDEILGIHSFDLDQKLEIEPDLLDEEHHHHHDDAVSSFALRMEQPLNLNRVEHLMQEIIQERGENLFRYKGVLSIKGVDKRVIFQGIHMLFAASMERNWKEYEERKSEIVFIGKELDQSWFEEQFQQCIAR
jgi:G3E family GTPase